MLGSQLLIDAPTDFAAVGTDLVAAREGHPEVTAVGVDLAEPDQVGALFAREGPFTAVVHAAAFTAVDRAESEEALALRVNGVASGVVARACARAGIPLVLLSTDFVFDGRQREPYGEEALPNPQSAYGRTKLAGEREARAAHPEGTRVVRTQWLYGPRGNHFPGTIVRLARERGELSVVNDQIGSPTSTLELAPALWDVVRIGEPGIYHAACEGACSWYDLAGATLARVGLGGVRLRPCSSAEFPRPAPRPAFSALACTRLTALRGRGLAAWRDALWDFLASAEDL